MKYLLTLICSLVFVFFQTPHVYAIEDPLRVPNNIFGIHIHDENDLPDAAKLVNSTGGDWGYVTLVVRHDQRNLSEMQRTFDKMRELHLIPIIRIATHPEGNSWAKGDSDQIDDWVSFLGNLNWVVKNRYIIIGNEPNHATEWGGEINPEEYSDYVTNFAIQLKENSDDFYVMMAGFDASAPTDALHLDEEAYIRRIVSKNPAIFDYIDGWSSHSYPNPGFSGLVTDTGRGSIRTYEWELELLKTLGITKNLPVFITETGWTHTMDGKVKKGTTGEAVADRFQKAFETVWNDSRIVAVTPFILNYNAPPFDTFSWKSEDGTFYPFFETVKNIPKIKGDPIIVNEAEIEAVVLPEILTIYDNVYGIAYIKNSGQKIWNPGIPQKVEIENTQVEVVPTNPILDLEPGQIGTALFRTISQETVHFELTSDKILLSFLNTYK